VVGSGRRSEDRYPRLPCPQAPLQSMTAAVSPTIPLLGSARPTSPFGRERTRERAAACIELGSRRRADDTRLRSREPEPSVQHPATHGGDLRRGRHRPRTDGRRSRRDARRHAPDRPERTLPTEAGCSRYRAPSGQGGKPPPASPHPATAGPEGPLSRSGTHERARGVELVTDHPQVHDTSSFTLGEPPTRLSGESQSSRRDFHPDVTPRGERNTQSPCSTDHRSIVTDRGPAASREALRWPLEGSQAIRCR
jgi:hypothetical protein